MYEENDVNNQQSETEIQDTYQQNTYEQPNDNRQPYAQQPVNEQPKKEGGVGFGIASLVLGILSLLLFCACINIPLAIMAVIFGIIQLVNGNGKGMAILGLVTAGLSIIAMIIFWAIVGFSMPSFMDSNAYTQFYEDNNSGLFDNNSNYNYDYDGDDDTF